MFKWRKVWKENVRKSTENSTATFLTNLFTKIGVYRACDKLLIWAELHRKSMFIITISFLMFVTVFSIAKRPRNDNVENSYIEQKRTSIKNINIEGIEKSKSSISTLFELARIKEEVRQMQEKGELTADDTLKIKELYNKVKQIK